MCPYIHMLCMKLAYAVTHLLYFAKKGYLMMKYQLRKNQLGFSLNIGFYPIVVFGERLGFKSP